MKQAESSLEFPYKQKPRHLNGWLLPVLVLFLFSLYVFTGFRGWLVFFIGFGGIWLVAFLWTFSLERNLWVGRRIHQAWAKVGESIPEQLVIVNKGWFSAPWVEITDESPGLESPLRLVTDVGRHSTRTRNPNHLFKKRGVYTLGPTQVRTGDPFGIYTLILHQPHSANVLVTPPILPRTQLRIQVGGRAGDERVAIAGRRAAQT